ncbi:MAG: TonB-dependent receptor, partial [Bacteroidota bacterium]
SARASFAQGFRAPSLKELSLFFVDVNHNIKGNNDLKAERSNNFLFSLTYLKEYKKIYWKADASLFYNKITDMISLAVNDLASQLYTYVNIDQYETHGLNMNTDVQYRNIRVNAGYGLTGRYNQLSKTTPTEDFLYSNEYKGNITYSFPKAKTDISLFYKYTGEVPSYIENNGAVYQGFTQAYQMLDASVTKQFLKNRFALTVGAKNLTDIKTINFSGTASAHTAGSGSALMAMGRYYFTSIRINIAKN